HTRSGAARDLAKACVESRAVQMPAGAVGIAHEEGGLELWSAPGRVVAVRAQMAVGIELWRDPEIAQQWSGRRRQAFADREDGSARVVDEQDTQAASCERRRGRRACGAATDNADVEGLRRARHSAGSGWRARFR